MDLNSFPEANETQADQKPVEDLDVEENEMIDLGNNIVVSKLTLLKAASYAQRKVYQFYGEVSFLLRPEKHDEKMSSDHYEPLTFLRSLGYQRNQAKEILIDPILYTNIYIILKEARLWTQSLEHSQATLLFEAADKLKRGRRAAEYIAIVTDAVINGNIPSYDELLAFTKFVEGIEDGYFSWDEIIPLTLNKEVKNIPYMLHQFEVEKVFMDTLKLVKHLKERDDQLLMAIADINEPDDNKEEPLDEPTDESSESSLSELSEDRLIITGASPLEHKLLKARRLMSDKEIINQCCIFANYYEPSMYNYVPLIAHIIARGYFTNYIQIEAVADFLRPICGMRPVRLVDVLNVVIKVSNQFPQENQTIQQVLISQKLLTGEDYESHETILNASSEINDEEIKENL